MGKSNTRRINGVEITGTPSADSIIKGTSTTTATWQTETASADAIIINPTTAGRNTISVTNVAEGLLITHVSGSAILFKTTGAVETLTVDSSGSVTIARSLTTAQAVSVTGYNTPGDPLTVNLADASHNAALYLEAGTGTPTLGLVDVALRAKGGSTAAIFEKLNTSAKPTVVFKRIGSQTSNLVEWQDETGAVLAYVDKDGNLSGAGGGGAGTVTSVAMTVPSILSVSGTPITSSGTLALSLATQTANKVFSGPTTGGSATPTFRPLVSADIPAIGVAQGGTGQSSFTKGDLIAATGSSTLAKLSVGSDGTILIADSTQSTGLAWGTPVPAGTNSSHSGTYSPSSITDFVYKMDVRTTAATFNLPAVTTSQIKFFVVKDYLGGGSTHNITINANGSDTIDGASSYVINAEYGYVMLYAESSFRWKVISGSSIPGTASNITGVAAIANGGTGQTTRTAAFNGLAPASAVKGDMLVFNGTDWVRLPVGTNNQLVTADSTQAAGVKWADAPSSTPDVAPRAWWSQQTGNSISSPGFGSSIVEDNNGSAGSLQDTTGYYRSETSNATTDNNAGWRHNGTMFSTDQLPSLYYVFKTGSDITNSRFWIGAFTSSDPMPSATPSNGIGFRYDTSTDGTAFWRTYTSDGTSVANASSVAIATSTKYVMKIVYVTSSSVQMYINGTLVDTMTTHLPTSSFAMYQRAYVRTLTNSAKTINVAKIGGSAL